MKATGVVVEYNPFHNGHLHHLRETRIASGADVVVAVMSGHFLQRGEPALVSKWARTRMALEAGVDVVIELPYCFATQHAEIFSRGAISLLDSIGCESFCFGSEDGDIDTFEKTVLFIEANRERYNTYIRRFIQDGMSYPSALAKAFQTLGNGDSVIDLSKPNNILGFHYMEARNQIHSTLKAYTITREAAGYHDQHFSSPSIASATSIRKSIFSSEGDHNIDSYLPSTSVSQLTQYQLEYGGFHRWENYWTILQYKLLASSREELKDIYEIEEGIENRMMECVKTSTSFKEFMTKLKTKRYTWTRLQRMLLHILTNTRKEEMRSRHISPSYIRLLGMNKTGREFIHSKKKEMPLPLISKLSSANQSEIELDVRAAEIFSLGLKNAAARKKLLHQEWSQPPVII
ncbi:nucleotidyltransferase [Rossellomorea aquimaris]|jgi:predicted nucleotidyltransferase|uniref:tRNA(Met) cytidine acetate ligase n=1 Tax=Rossellomorea aquimaris TaxID=189382 RepID=A0A5D4UEA3_9BACI|nr:nucleotidyltransferase [Rossellomorea aquimaris]TYS80418.1 nucleotidyltransferase [Rossellomorea aquimaris]TYS85805.1 nucleotidyltransferase [Rossellomorea aquimaris]